MPPFVLHGYQTPIFISIGATPFSLVYSMEAILPIEVKIPPMRILTNTKLEEVEWIQNMFDQLNLINEKRVIALCHGKLYHKQLNKAFDKKVYHREFKEGDLVLNKILPIHKGSREKWTPNYKGPYVVKKAFSEGDLILTTRMEKSFHSQLTLMWSKDNMPEKKDSPLIRKLERATYTKKKASRWTEDLKGRSRKKLGK